MYIKALLGEKNESLMSPTRGVTQCFFHQIKSCTRRRQKMSPHKEGKTRKSFLLLQELMLLMLLLNCINKPFMKYLVFKNRKGRVHLFLHQACGRTVPFSFSNRNMKIYNSLVSVTRFGSTCSQKPSLEMNGLLVQRHSLDS